MRRSLSASGRTGAPGANLPADGAGCRGGRLPAGVLLPALLLCSLPAAAMEPARPLADMSFEELANIQITSVSKKAENLGDAPASIYVITHDDIRRYGALTLPEALRLAPNLQVARVNAQQYAISARGFNNATGNKLLVLIDGRIVYTPLFSGVFWDAQDVLLEDIDRIEVISGPGGTLWGTNAVNGVINIMTRAAAETQGTLLVAGAGHEAAALAGLRHGARLGADAHFRVYAKVIDHDDSGRAGGQPAQDAWRRAQGGFRFDRRQGHDRLTVQGDVQAADLDKTGAEAATSGAHLMVHWRHALEDDAGLSLLAYYDRSERDFPGVYLQTLDTANAEFQHTLKPWGVHAPIWGASVRHAHDEEENTSMLAFLPAQLDQQWYSLFGRDEIALHEDWRLILGTRLEHNDYTGVEFLPSLRLAWQLADNRLLWGAVSRVVRAPSRVDRDFNIPGQPPFLLRGNNTFESETAVVYELGYRAQPHATLSWSATVFYTGYDDLRTVEPVPGGFVVGNGMEGSTGGLETWGTWQVTPRWRLAAGATALEARLRLKPGSGNPGGTGSEGNDPEQTAQLRSTLNLGARHELDLTLRHVADLPKPAVPAHAALDVHWGWKVTGTLAVDVVAQNLGDRSQPEFGSAATRSEIPSGYFVKLTWQR